MYDLVERTSKTIALSHESESIKRLISQSSITIENLLSIREVVANYGLDDLIIQQFNLKELLNLSTEEFICEVVVEGLIDKTKAILKYLWDKLIAFLKTIKQFIVGVKKPDPVEIRFKKYADNLDKLMTEKVVLSEINMVSSESLRQRDVFCMTLAIYLGKYCELCELPAHLNVLKREALKSSGVTSIKIGPDPLGEIQADGVTTQKQAINKSDWSPFTKDSIYGVWAERKQVADILGVITETAEARIILSKHTVNNSSNEIEVGVEKQVIVELMSVASISVTLLRILERDTLMYNKMITELLDTIDKYK